MIHQAPAGARDLLPLEVAQKSWINDRLQEVFQRWGYKRIVTSTIEWVDTLMAGGAIEPSTVVQLQNIGEGRLGLRPELTASIARAAVNRLSNQTIQRLCYRANVFRNPPAGHHGKQLEFYQAGVELLYAEGVLADGEIILLLINCLQSLGIEGAQLLLGDAGLTRSLLNTFPCAFRKQILDAIASLDRVKLQKLDLEDNLKSKALQLFDLRGNPQEVLARVADFDLDETAQKAVNHLQSLMDLINHSCEKPLPITLDLSLIQTFDYYTGIVFEIVQVMGNKPYVLGQGGRYDQLLEVYHPQKKNAPGIGFCFNIQDLHNCLLNSPNLPQSTPPSDWLVIPTDIKASNSAFAYAQKLRNTNHIVRVEIDLKMRTPDEIRNYALEEGISYLAWVDENGNAKIETAN
ncbi:ATP phosphoribosyltransferase regulatory subunit [Cyanobacterium aponinum UTEX 3222]|uniref:ATP phosphoribosyltransferase regulatory subunit n=1 Tax=Cyanobacterium aponinum TaxID=379064 RepID=UPI002B4C1DF4|nr:ATP phosphoribosyltransferase regulatory subunit [Cyanobacterium aponinum]WRL39365.1 ATP phosphoribosyltransferase regulatory subunit [Cyanobacterium aponinum UTEX 3221]WRL43938.1 ATP phosphoribosyltransferase regulatory subunit [Cyanobacterium aponinum UTEX 3222]